jgi:GNAT superfamily N-acetyltransferase
VLGKTISKRALQYLEQDVVLNIGMIEPINRGTAELIYAEKDGVLLLEKKSGAYMMSVDEPDLAERLVAGIIDAKLFVVYQEFCLPIINNSFGLVPQFQCLQAAYLNKTLIPPDVSIKICMLNGAHFQEVLKHYHTIDDPDYIMKLIDNGQIYGAFVNGRLAGFIGIHLEGSIGMLEVLPDFRRRGIGYALESYIVNMMIKKGWTPFCEVFENNFSSINLQKKLGFELSNQYIYWFF